MKYEMQNLDQKLLFSHHDWLQRKKKTRKLEYHHDRGLEIQLETREGHLVNHSRNTYCDYMLDTVPGA